jgi:hypothetical protein
MLQEKMAELSRGHDGRSSNQYTPHDELCAVWLAKNCPGFPERTARRWRTAARHVMCLLLEIPDPADSHPPVFMELDGQEHLISTVLTMPNEESTPAMRTFQDTFNTFLADKTLAEAAACALDGEDEPSRIVRAANGKHKGGKGGDRRNYSKFVAVHYSALSHIYATWDRIHKNDPSQHSDMTAAVKAHILGGTFTVYDLNKIGERKRIWTITLKPLPQSVRKLMFDALKESFKQAPQD